MASYKSEETRLAASAWADEQEGRDICRVGLPVEEVVEDERDEEGDEHGDDDDGERGREGPCCPVPQDALLFHDCVDLDSKHCHAREDADGRFEFTSRLASRAGGSVA